MRRAYLILLPAALAPCVASAQTESRVSADVSATAGYSNNPFAILGDDTGSALIGIDIAPQYQLLTPRSTYTVSADVNLQQYLRRYGRNDNYSGAVDYQGRPSERVTTHARIDLASTVLGSFNNYLPFAAGAAPIVGTGAGTAGGAGTGAPVVVPVTPGTSLVPITDIGLFGLRNRRNLARLSGDTSIGVSASDTLTISAYGEVARYQDLSLGNYEAYSGSLGYSRRLSAYATAGLRGTVSRFNYRTNSGDADVYTVEATGSIRLNEFWTADGALGVSFVNSGGARATNSTSLSGSLSLCRRGQFSSMCLQAARQVSPTGLAGSQYVTSAGLNWNRQLNERDNLSLGANYSKVGNDRTALVLGGLPLQTEYVQAVAGYNRRLRERLRLTTSANYRQLLGRGNADRPKDFGGQIGLSYRLGDQR